MRLSIAFLLAATVDFPLLAWDRRIVTSTIAGCLVNLILNRGTECWRRLTVGVLPDVPEAEKEGPMDDLLMRVAGRLLSLALYFKHPAFASEEEWRVSLLETADDTGRFDGVNAG